MEKRRPAFDLATIQAELDSPQRLRMTFTARQGAVALRMTDRDVVQVIQRLTPRHFYKSMTTHASAQAWQDVYHAEWSGVPLYVKFALDAQGHFLISFKER